MGMLSVTPAYTTGSYPAFREIDHMLNLRHSRPILPQEKENQEGSYTAESKPSVGLIVS